MSNTVDLRIKGFLNGNIELLNSNNFEELYRKFQYVAAINTPLTEILYQAGINPLEYMTKVPEYYAAGSGIIEEVSIPENITVIGSHAFEECINLRNVYISKSVTEIKYDAFARINDCVFTYNGTKEEFLKIDFYHTSFPKDSLIKCSDTVETFQEISNDIYVW